ncbi:MAG: 3-terminal phosphate cyclase [Candidatus Methanomethylophilaceae archaeon]|nr:3-terminal phosphate cyclase [Candidatus Methanomethylophilaceae archaeon]MDI3541477.1 3-terminal phosphate cyclase [Candidatus Methanomethylophilaceae archaeon]
MIEIDGSLGEGGGQIVRTSIALATLTGKDLHLINIRENRPTRGLSRQHCAAINAVAEFNGSRVSGNVPNSTELIFRPGEGGPKEISLDIGSAGSISLVLQAVLLSAQSHDSKVVVDIRGGTDVRWAPPIDFYPQVMFPLLARMGIHAKMKIVKRGFYPKGGGEVHVEIKPPKHIDPLCIDELGALREIDAISYCQNLPERVCKEMARSCEELLSDFAPLNVEHELRHDTSTGAGISLVASFEHGLLGASALGSKGIPARLVGEEAAKNLIIEIEGGGTLDMHAADQLVPYMALAEGESRFRVWRISRHLLSQMGLLEKFLDAEFRISKLQHGYQIGVVPGKRE